MSTDRDTLLSMGFDPQRVEWALKATGNAGLQPAMDHILEHDGQPVPDLSSVSSAPSRAAPTGDDDDEDAEALRALIAKGGNVAASQAAISEQEARSIKCSLCGKIFKNTALANFHAEKSGHDQFEESTEEVKPLTEEEKKQKLQELREKLAAKRATKSVEEAKEHKANETIRRKAGKDAGQIREELKLKEAEKEAEKKKREKIEDARARAAVKAQIEADKKARAERAAREKAAREGNLVAETAPVTVASPAAAASSATAGRDYKETRLQIRMATAGAGGPYTTSLPSESTLREVAEFVAGQNISVDVESVTFTQQFPRKVFTQADWSKSLRDLGLTPSAVLIAS
ncbi:hypothetical protein EXIGLDRAFT_721964 [Exidia glandulosa HHB12029]|uniref:UBX domain-containing protein n=1 Tax=Exidia glandulosa HHB12029 TaxID=1314781 RepID=A0A165NAA0_EXIGL|nr:hypothetical protein EXIGLDRAFT_721964 [Exidia glandulosa HHB12029]